MVRNKRNCMQYRKRGRYKGRRMRQEEDEERKREARGLAPLMSFLSCAL